MHTDCAKFTIRAGEDMEIPALRLERLMVSPQNSWNARSAMQKTIAYFDKVVFESEVLM